ncbi:DEKNAAC103230 [Brettanomyces naardenensis]|uniref:DEKNAAC103230 n=1 Tax=Brettanomyces naardenensis TaxID=13370 RepID=A0A448YMM7_BRENA|nr:DEKNAAC103230 [Brettanomyces naardenensis]
MYTLKELTSQREVFGSVYPQLVLTTRDYLLRLASTWDLQARIPRASSSSPYQSNAYPSLDC